jgi:hypothetical protein
MHLARHFKTTMMQPVDVRREKSFFFLSSDLDDDNRFHAENEKAAQQSLDFANNFCEKAKDVLSDLESNGMLGSAIVRKCQELADAVGGLAEQLESRNDDERNALAKACLEDMQTKQPHSLLTASENEDELQLLTLDDMNVALVGGQELLRDVEASLRSIRLDEADEIADVALTLANMFLLSLQNFLDSTSPKDIANATNPAYSSRNIEFSGRIELLDDHEEEDEPVLSKPRPKQPRVRCMWPPLGPAVATTLEWTQHEASKQPLLSVALGLVLWPMAVSTALIGTPIIVGDAIVQKVYDSFQHTPFGDMLEGGAAQALYAGKLTFLSTKLVAKQAIRVAFRQLDRRGGLGAVVGEIKDVVVDRVLHPVESAQQLWSGISLGVGMVQDAVTHFQANMAKEQEQAQVSDLQ